MPARFRVTSCRLALFLATLLPLPALAQQGTGATVSPQRQGARPAEPSRAPGLTGSIDDPATLLRLAEATLGAGRQAGREQAGREREVLDLLERAESRLLTRSELASRAGVPRERGVVGEIAAARAALAGRDRDEARFRIVQALAWLDEAAPPAAPTPLEATPFDNSGASPPPAQATEGGGQPARYAPLPGIAPQDMPVGGTTSPPVPIGPDTDQPRAAANPGDIPPSSTKAPIM